MIKNKVCSILGNDQASCDVFVDSFGILALQMLSSKIDPSVMCKNIRLCPKESRSIVIKPTVRLHIHEYDLI